MSEIESKAKPTIEWDLRRITLGNVLTLVSGGCIAIGAIFAVGQWQEGLSNHLTRIDEGLRHIECILAKDGLETSDECRALARAEMSDGPKLAKAIDGKGGEHVGAESR